MRTIVKFAAVSAVVFPAFAFIAATDSAAVAAPAHLGGSYCLQYDMAAGRGDCTFMTFAQCEESASGINAECHPNVFDHTDSDL